MGFFEEFLSQQVKKIEKTLSVDTDVEVIEGNSTELNNLLNKLDEILQRENSIENPKIYRKEAPVFDGEDAFIYVTDTKKILVFEKKILYKIHLNGNEENIPLSSYCFCYAQNNETGMPCLGFSFGELDDSGSLFTIRFSSEKREIQVSVKLRVIDDANAPKEAIYNEFNLGFKTLLKKLYHKELFTHFDTFLNHLRKLREPDFQKRKEAENKEILDDLNQL